MKNKHALSSLFLIALLGLASCSTPAITDTSGVQDEQTESIQTAAVTGTQNGTMTSFHAGNWNTASGITTSLSSDFTFGPRGVASFKSTKDNGWVNQAGFLYPGHYRAYVLLAGNGTVTVEAQKGGGDYSSYKRQTFTLNNVDNTKPTIASFEFDKPIDVYNNTQFTISGIDRAENVMVSWAYFERL